MSFLPQIAPLHSSRPSSQGRSNPSGAAHAADRRALERILSRPTFEFVPGVPVPPLASPSSPSLQRTNIRIRGAWAEASGYPPSSRRDASRDPSRPATRTHTPTNGFARTHDAFQTPGGGGGSAEESKQESLFSSTAPLSSHVSSTASLLVFPSPPPFAPPSREHRPPATSPRRRTREELIPSTHFRPFSPTSRILTPTATTLKRLDLLREAEAEAEAEAARTRELASKREPYTHLPPSLRCTPYASMVAHSMSRAGSADSTDPLPLPAGLTLLSEWERDLLRHLARVSRSYFDLALPSSLHPTPFELLLFLEHFTQAGVRFRSLDAAVRACQEEKARVSHFLNDRLRSRGLLREWSDGTKEDVSSPLTPADSDAEYVERVDAVDLTLLFEQSRCGGNLLLHARHLHASGRSFANVIDLTRAIIEEEANFQRCVGDLFAFLTSPSCALFSPPSATSSSWSSLHSLAKSLPHITRNRLLARCFSWNAQLHQDPWLRDRTPPVSESSSDLGARPSSSNTFLPFKNLIALLSRVRTEEATEASVTDDSCDDADDDESLQLSSFFVGPRALLDESAELTLDQLQQLSRALKDISLEPSVATTTHADVVSPHEQLLRHLGSLRSSRRSRPLESFHALLEALREEHVASFQRRVAVHAWLLQESGLFKSTPVRPDVALAAISRANHASATTSILAPESLCLLYFRCRGAHGSHLLLHLRQALAKQTPHATPNFTPDAPFLTCALDGRLVEATPTNSGLECARDVATLIRLVDTAVVESQRDAQELHAFLVSGECGLLAPAATAKGALRVQDATHLLAVSEAASYALSYAHAWNSRLTNASSLASQLPADKEEAADSLVAKTFDNVEQLASALKNHHAAVKQSLSTYLSSHFSSVCPSLSSPSDLDLNRVLSVTRGGIISLRLILGFIETPSTTSEPSCVSGGDDATLGEFCEELRLLAHQFDASLSDARAMLTAPTCTLWTDAFRADAMRAMRPEQDQLVLLRLVRGVGLDFCSYLDTLVAAGRQFSDLSSLHSSLKDAHAQAVQAKMPLRQRLRTVLASERSGLLRPFACTKHQRRRQRLENASERNSNNHANDANKDANEGAAPSTLRLSLTDRQLDGVLSVCGGSIDTALSLLRWLDDVDAEFESVEGLVRELGQVVARVQEASASIGQAWTEWHLIDETRSTCTDAGAKEDDAPVVRTVADMLRERPYSPAIDLQLVVESHCGPDVIVFLRASVAAGHSFHSLEELVHFLREQWSVTVSTRRRLFQTLCSREVHIFAESTGKAAARAQAASRSGDAKSDEDVDDVNDALQSLATGSNPTDPADRWTLTHRDLHELQMRVGVHAGFFVDALVEFAPIGDENEEASFESSAEMLALIERMAAASHLAALNFLVDRHSAARAAVAEGRVVPPEAFDYTSLPRHLLQPDIYTGPTQALLTPSLVAHLTGEGLVDSELEASLDQTRARITQLFHTAEGLTPYVLFFHLVHLANPSQAPSSAFDVYRSAAASAPFDSWAALLVAVRQCQKRWMEMREEVLVVLEQNRQAADAAASEQQVEANCTLHSPIPFFPRGLDAVRLSDVDRLLLRSNSGPNAALWIARYSAVQQVTLGPFGDGFDAPLFRSVAHLTDQLSADTHAWRSGVASARATLHQALTESRAQLFAHGVHIDVRDLDALLESVLVDSAAARDPAFASSTAAAVALEDVCWLIAHLASLGRCFDDWTSFRATADFHWHHLRQTTADVMRALHTPAGRGMLAFLAPHQALSVDGAQRLVRQSGAGIYAGDIIDAWIDGSSASVLASSANGLKQRWSDEDHITPPVFASLDALIATMRDQFLHQVIPSFHVAHGALVESVLPSPDLFVDAPFVLAGLTPTRVWSLFDLSFGRLHTSRIVRELLDDLRIFESLEHLTSEVHAHVRQEREDRRLLIDFFNDPAASQALFAPAKTTSSTTTSRSPSQSMSRRRIERIIAHAGECSSSARRIVLDLLATGGVVASFADLVVRVREAVDHAAAQTADAMIQMRGMLADDGCALVPREVKLDERQMKQLIKITGGDQQVCLALLHHLNRSHALVATSPHATRSSRPACDNFDALATTLLASYDHLLLERDRVCAFFSTADGPTSTDAQRRCRLWAQGKETESSKSNSAAMPVVTPDSALHLMASSAACTDSLALLHQLNRSAAFAFRSLDDLALGVRTAYLAWHDAKWSIGEFLSSRECILLRTIPSPTTDESLLTLIDIDQLLLAFGQDIYQPHRLIAYLRAANDAYTQARSSKPADAAVFASLNDLRDFLRGVGDDSLRRAISEATDILLAPTCTLLQGASSAVTAQSVSSLATATGAGVDLPAYLRSMQQVGCRCDSLATLQAELTECVRWQPIETAAGTEKSA